MTDRYDLFNIPQNDGVLTHSAFFGLIAHLQFSSPRILHHLFRLPRYLLVVRLHQNRIDWTRLRSTDPGAALETPSSASAWTQEPPGTTDRVCLRLPTSLRDRRIFQLPEMVHATYKLNFRRTNL